MPLGAGKPWDPRDERDNPEISTQLFIGPRPARWHLRKVQSPKPPGLRSFGHAYPGRLEQVQRVRADLGAILNGCPIADETILVGSELAANAVTHSSSRQPGGRFIVRAEVCPGDYVGVEVEDQGDPWGRPSFPGWPAPRARHRPGHRWRRPLGHRRRCRPRPCRMGPA